MAKINDIKRQLRALRKQEKRIRALIRFKKRHKMPSSGEIAKLADNLSEQNELLRQLLNASQKDIENAELGHATNHRKD
jgi:hypothetical protein